MPLFVTLCTRLLQAVDIFYNLQHLLRNIENILNQIKNKTLSPKKDMTDL